MKLKFTVTGMTCSACATRVENCVKKLDGIEFCSVNLITGLLTVESKTDISEEIKSAVVSEGYGIKDGASHVKNRDREKSLFIRLLISLPLSLLLIYIAMGGMIGLYIPKFISSNKFVSPIIQAVISFAVIVINYKYFTVGYKNLVKLKPNMDSLVALGSSVSFIYGLISVIVTAIKKGGNMNALYFEGSATVLALIDVGKFLEEKSKTKTMGAIDKLLNLSPNTAVILKEGQEVTVNAEELKVGDTVVLKDGFSVPSDGKIIFGGGYLDESNLTGESMPVYKSINDELYSGTSFKGGYAKMTVTAVLEDSSLYKIIRLVEDANSTKVPLVKLADKIAGVFVPTVIGISVVAFLIWLIVKKDFAFAVNIAVSVLVVSCPCALGLATPSALMVGTGKSAENGILIKNGEALQNLAMANFVVLDKTGTVTYGKPEVKNFEVDNENKELVLSAICSIENRSSHLLSKAIKEYGEKLGVKLKEVEDFEVFDGLGVKGSVDGDRYAIGNFTFIKSETDKEFQEIYDGGTVLYISKNADMIGYMSISDKIKPTSKIAVRELKNAGLSVVMLTGDNENSAKSVASEIDCEYKAGVLPIGKYEYIDECKKQGKKVIMVGDGVNDAPALSLADVGIAIGCGTDVAIESCDVVLIKDDLCDVVNAVKVGKSVIKNVKENLFWAFFYNVLLIPVAGGILYYPFGVTLNPMFASMAMSLSSLFVVGNALRLNFIKLKKESENMKEQGTVLSVEGMMCEHCKKRVEDAVKSVGYLGEVNLKKNNVTVYGEGVDIEKVKRAIEEQGYKVN